MDDGYEPEAYEPFEPLLDGRSFYVTDLSDRIMSGPHATRAEAEELLLAPTQERIRDNVYLFGATG